MSGLSIIAKRNARAAASPLPLGVPGLSLLNWRGQRLEMAEYAMLCPEESQLRGCGLQQETGVKVVQAEQDMIVAAGYRCSKK
jgi:hypothetical protein